MRIARKLFLLAFAAVAAMAFAAPAASADLGIEVLPEPGVSHCAQVFLDGDHNVTGGCAVTAHSGATTPATLHRHEGTEEHIISICNNEFEGRLNESGSGWIYNQVLTSANCGLAPCDEAETGSPKLAWPATLREEAGNTILRVAFCIRTLVDPEGTIGTTCVVDVAVNAVVHDYEFAASESPCLNLGGVIELSGGWHIEGTPIEITHPTP